MKRIKKIAIFANSERLPIKKALDEMEEYFLSKEIQVEVVKLSGTPDDDTIAAPVCDLAISLGGDGTVLTTAVILKDGRTPLLAVNKGHFGYITETSVSEYKKVFEAYQNGESELAKRLMLSIQVLRNGKSVFDSVALNEVTAVAATRSKIAKIKLVVNGTLAANLKADGIIVATPTGSTAYSLSAGGPVLEAGIRSLIINPVCPFSMSVRPLIVPDSAEIKLQIPSQKSVLTLTADGHGSIDLEEGDEVVIQKYPKEIPFVKNPDRNFIETLRDKLGWAGELNA